MKTLVTGASGFVGAHVARAARDAGHDVRLLLRAGCDRRLVRDLDAEIAAGDLTDPASLRRAVAGCRVLFHVGALYSLARRDRLRVEQVNVEGTRALLEAALAAGVERVVYTSSVAAVGLRCAGAGGRAEAEPGMARDLAGPRGTAKPPELLRYGAPTGARRDARDGPRSCSVTAGRRCSGRPSAANTHRRQPGTTLRNHSATVAHRVEPQALEPKRRRTLGRARA